MKGKLPVVHDVAPPIYKLTQGAPRLGFVNFDTASDADGTLRRIPLMVEWNGLLLEQLAFAAARDAMGIQPADLSIADTGHLVIAGSTSGRPAMRLQLDESGRALINWHSQAAGWNRCFGHLPVTRILQIHDIRKSIRQNDAVQAGSVGRGHETGQG